MMQRVKAKVKVKIFTEFGYWCLAEIRGLKEGTILEGSYNPENNAFDFTYQGQDAMLWVNQNAELISAEDTTPAYWGRTRSEAIKKLTKVIRYEKEIFRHETNSPESKE